MKRYLIAIVFGSLIFAAPLAQAAPEAFEVAPDQADLLPGGKEADGIIGDFILRNDMVEAVISCNAVLRKANMGTNWTAVTPGCLYDLTYRGENNDQLTHFAPLGQQGPVSYVRIVSDGSDGAAAVEAVVSAALNGGVSTRHVYLIKEGWRGLSIATTLKNESNGTKTIKTADRISRFTDVKTYGNITVADAIDPADKCGYAYGWLSANGATVPGGEITLKPGEEAYLLRYFTVGHSPAEAYGMGVMLTAEDGAGTLNGALTGENGDPVVSGKITIQLKDGAINAYPGADGRWSTMLAPGEYKVTFSDIGRESESVTVNVQAGETTTVNHKMAAPSAIAFDIRGEKGESLPCKAHFEGLEGTPQPNLGPDNRAHGCADQYHSETGKFEVQLAPGRYRVIVTHGVEFSHLEQEIELKPGKTAAFKGVLKRLVDTSGWVSADFHNHSTPSGDNTTGTDDRIINLAAEQVEFAPTTEHNRLYDWTPHIEKLGLSSQLNTIPGVELTGPAEHFNAFPFKPVPRTQDGGAPVWNDDPRIAAITLRNFQGPIPERWVQINHPNMVHSFTDRDGDGMRDNGFEGLKDLIDAAETWGPNTYDDNILTRAPYRIITANEKERVYMQRQFIWLQLLNMGHRYWSVAVSDAHSVYGNGVGGWRTYIPSSTDDPAKIDWKEIIANAKRGRILITNGPFLQVETEDGQISGGSARAAGSIGLHVKVQCTDWIDIDRVQVLVNGRQRKDVNFTRESHPDWFSDGVVKFDRDIDVALSEDSQLIVVAYGKNFTLKTGYGTSWQSSMNPCAYINPIFVDVDGGGFTPNGDTLDFPLPTAGVSVAEAKAMLNRFETEK
ncbi:MAG: hypothetical protein GC154_18235 [bacterium]|nr:hypothetical protein [bacterium]